MFDDVYYSHRFVQSDKMIDVEKIVNRVIADIDLDVCVICESVLVDSRNNVVCDDCLKVENDV